MIYTAFLKMNQQQSESYSGNGLSLLRYITTSSGQGLLPLTTFLFWMKGETDMSEQLVHHQHHTNTNIHKIILSDKEKTIMKKSKSVDNSALTYYESGFEKNRLISNIGII